MIDFKIRNATKEDLPSILEILNREILNTTVVYDYEPKSLQAQTEWLEKKQEADLPVIVAEQDGKVLAYGTYSIFRPWEAYKFSIEHSIYVHPTARGLGIGQVMMKKMIQLATEKGFHTMIAGIDSSNQGSIEFHKKFGFENVGTLKNVGFKFGKWLDLVFMQLIIQKK